MRHAFEQAAPLILGVVVPAMLVSYGYGERACGLWIRVTARRAGGERLVDAAVFSFSTWSTLRGFWRSGGHALFAVSAAAAGVPYANCAATAALWAAPSLDDARRALALSVLHQSVKFTQVAMLSIVLMLVSFSARVVLPLMVAHRWHADALAVVCASEPEWREPTQRVFGGFGSEGKDSGTGEGRRRPRIRDDARREAAGGAVVRCGQERTDHGRVVVCMT